MKTTKNINSNHDAGNMLNQKTNEDFNKEQPSPKNFKNKGKSSSSEITGLGNKNEELIKTEVLDEVNGAIKYTIRDKKNEEETHPSIAKKQ
jgi:hypothetical protein